MQILTTLSCPLVLLARCSCQFRLRADTQKRDPKEHAPVRISGFRASCRIPTRSSLSAAGRMEAANRKLPRSQLQVAYVFQWVLRIHSRGLVADKIVLRNSVEIVEVAGRRENFTKPSRAANRRRQQHFGFATQKSTHQNTRSRRRYRPANTLPLLGQLACMGGCKAKQILRVPAQGRRQQ